MSTFAIKRNDTSPSWVVTLTEAAGNLSGATVNMHMKLPGASSAKVDAACTIVDATAGTVRYDWSSGDTDTAGLYEAEFEVTYSDATVETFPNVGFFLVNVDGDLA